jgi:hypothetical protein
MTKHCGKKHPSKAEDECWELETNKDSRPSTWKSNKSNTQGKESKVESEMWQPGVIQNKINEHHTYLDATNYWTPLNKDNDNNEEDEEKINTLDSTTAISKPKSNKRMRRLARKREHKLTKDSGATSNFVCRELNLPKDGISNKEVFLPDDSKLKTSHKTKLPIKQLSDAAREAHILPGLKQSLLSVNKMSEVWYTTIFHPGEEGVSIHKKRYTHHYNQQTFSPPRVQK